MKREIIPQTFEPAASYIPSGLPGLQDWLEPKDVNIDLLDKQVNSVNFPVFRDSRVWIHGSEKTMSFMSYQDNGFGRMDWVKSKPLHQAPASVRKQFPSLKNEEAYYQVAMSASIETGATINLCHLARHMFVFKADGSRLFLSSLIVKLMDQPDPQGKPPAISISMPHQQKFVKPGKIHPRDTLMITPILSMATTKKSYNNIVDSQSILKTAKLGLNTALSLKTTLSVTGIKSSPVISNRLLDATKKHFSIDISGSPKGLPRARKKIKNRIAIKLRAPLK